MTTPEYLELNNSSTNRRWLLAQPSPDLICMFERELNVTRIIAKLLINRKIENVRDAEAFLKPDFFSLMPEPKLLKGMEPAIIRITSAIEKRDKICIWGDYDVDGTVATSVLFRFLKGLGGDVIYYIPDRLSEGYGLNDGGIEAIKNENVSLLIAVDCGTSNAHEIDFATQLGLDTIIIDHHKVTDELPRATAFINPQQPEQVEAEKFTPLCAAGLVFLLVVALNRELKGINFYNTKSVKEPDLKTFLGLIALATVCDVMVLIGLNRAYVFHGLRLLGENKDPHLKQLESISGVDKTNNVAHLGFILGPRINAAGRVGKYSSLAVKYFTSTEQDDLINLARELHSINAYRQEIENDNLLSAENKLSPTILEKKYILISSEAFHSGVIGIVAGRLKEKYHKPVFIVQVDGINGKGSARSIDGVDIGAIVHRGVQAGVVSAGGGHKMAAGFSLLMENIKNFELFLDKELNSIKIAPPALKIDAMLSLSNINSKIIHEIEQLEPFGMGTPAPKFLFPRLIITRFDILKEKHIKCLISDEAGNKFFGFLFNGVSTGLGTCIMETPSSKRVDVVGSIKMDTWNGRKQIKIMIEDIGLSK